MAYQRHHLSNLSEDEIAQLMNSVSTNDEGTGNVEKNSDLYRNDDNKHRI